MTNTKFTQIGIYRTLAGARNTHHRRYLPGDSSNVCMPCKIVGTYDGTTFKLYVNGVLEGSAVSTYVPASPTQPGFTIGSRNGITTAPSYIQDVALYSGPESTPIRARVNQVLTFEGLERRQTDAAGPGDIVLVNGIEGIGIGVTLTDTFLMLPNKTVSGIFYPTEVDFVTCQLCHRDIR